MIKLGEYIVLDDDFQKIPNFVIPSRLALSNNFLLKKENDRIQFVIPGDVLQIKRDYISILSAFLNIFSKNPFYKNKVRIVLLGRMRDKKVKEFITKSELKEVVVYYNEFVSEEEYNYQMAKSHFAIFP
ncbi:MAG: hypothetical protein J7L58_03965 [Thermoplasmata archaeon]|nr:hypothetical protein [Thermoplasmata archaeon]